MTQGLTIVQLTPLQAEQFLLFQKHFGNFKKQLDAGVFDIREGSAILDFDSSGNIGGIKKVVNYNYNKA